MRHGWAVVFLLLTGLLGGCVSEQSLSDVALLTHSRSATAPMGSDVVVLDIGLVERHVNDDYLTAGLWTRANEQDVGLEQKVLLEQNGLQVGQLSVAPPELLALLTAERSCINPRRVLLHSGGSYSIVLGPPLPSCEFTLHQEDDGGEVEKFDQAICTLQVTPTLTNDGRTVLRFTPQINHGQANLVFKPSENGVDWALNEQRPTATYPWLSWEITVSPNEYVLVGGRVNYPGTLGHQCFVRPDEPGKVQRLLAVRTSRALPGVSLANHNDLGDPEEARQHAPPLAWQATMTPVRASAP